MASESDHELTVHTREKVDTKNIYDDDTGISIIKKHESEKLNVIKAANSSKFDKMEHFLECGFNLLVYGVGSKRETITNFCKDRI